LTEALQLHLGAFARLSEGDRSLLARIAARNVREIGPRRDLVREGEKPRAMILILDGWAATYKQLRDGRRQITSFLVPGDSGDANVFVLARLDHSITSITPVRYAELSQADFDAMVTESPGIARAVWGHELAVASIYREWVLNIGQRNAMERIAHLICELFLKLEAVGLTDGVRFDWPLTQADVADATGLTSVHVNRTLQHLRRDGLIETSGRRLAILDLARLKSVASFNPDYLHLDGGGPGGPSEL
jgi:CRP-like cAMP-binding protein